MAGTEPRMELSRVHIIEGKHEILCCAAGYARAKGEKRRGGAAAARRGPEEEGDMLFFCGTGDGTVWMYRVVKPYDGWPKHYDRERGWDEKIDQGTRVGGRAAALVLRKQHAESAGKKGVAQLEVDSATSRLFVLCDGAVKMFRWDGGLHELDQAKEEKKQVLKGVGCFCISSDGDKHRLCACVKKRPFLYTYMESGFGLFTGDDGGAVLAEAGDVIQSCAWVGSLLCLAARGEYRVVDADTCHILHICDRGSRGAPKGGPSTLVLRDRVEVVNSGGGGDDDAPEQVAEFRTGLLQQRGKQMYFFPQDFAAQSGEEREPEQGKAWPSDLRCSGARGEPLLGFCSRQYLVGVLQDGVYTHSFFDRQTARCGWASVSKSNKVGQLQDTDRAALHKHVQSATSTDACVFLCTQRDVYAATVVPYHHQVTDLAKGGGDPGDIEQAELLLRQTYPSGLQPGHGPHVHERERLQAELELRLAHIYKEAGFAQYEQGQFETAFACFHRSWEADHEYFDIREVLRLFEAQEMVKLARPLQEYMSSLPESKVERRDLKEVGEELQWKPQQQTKLLRNANQCLYEHLKKVRVLGESFADEDDVDDGAGPSTAQEEHQYRAIDTALLFLYLELYPVTNAQSDQEIRTIFCDGNRLEYEVCAKELQKRGKYRCLALLMMHHNRIPEALEMLQKLGDPKSEDVQEEEQNGVRETVLALQHCRSGEEDNSTVLRYLPWILEEDADEAIDALLVRRDPPIPPEQVMPLIEDLPDDLVQKYLRHIIYEEQNTDPEHHTQLALIWVRAILLLLPLTQVKGTPLTIRAGEEAGLLGTMRRDLRNFLQDSRHYRESEVLAHLYGTPLHEELVVVYSRTGEHEAALRILLYEMKDPLGAQEYCERQYQTALEAHLQRHMRGVGRADESRAGGGVDDDAAADGAGGEIGSTARSRPEEVFASNSIPNRDSRGNVFVGIRKHNTYILDLLNLCLYPDRGEVSDRHPNVELAADLLQRYSRSLDPLLVLNLVPADVFSVAQLRPYLRQVFQHTVSQTHKERIHHRLAVANHRKHQMDLGIMRKRSIIIDSDRVCNICQKRIGEGSVFGVFPNMLVAHYRCVDRSVGGEPTGARNKDPVTGRRFWVDIDAVHPREKYCH